eukprot:Sdes_comp8993_c0_seq2m406
MASNSELACVYASLILHDDDVEITGEKIAKICAAAKVNVDSYWPGLFASALQGKNIGDLIANVGSASAAPAAAAAPAGGRSSAPSSPKKGAAAAKKPEPEAESDDDMGFGLFD